MIDFILKGMESHSLFSILLGYVGGVLASLTPCVYPMIPIVVGVIGASRSDNKVRGLTLSISYALGLSLVYTGLGIFAAVTGGFFGEIATNPWSYIIFGILSILLSLWMMDWIHIPIPSSCRSVDMRGHGGVFVTGAMSGLVAAPCTSPVLGGLLLYVSKTKDIFMGGATLFAFSLGMTTILIAIGTFSGMLKSLPVPGKWMVWVKRALAFSLFAFGAYFIITGGELLI